MQQHSFDESDGRVSDNADHLLDRLKFTCAAGLGFL